MSNVNRIFIVSAFILLMFIFVMTCESFEGRFVSNDGNMVVSYRVDEGYKITIKVDTRRKKGAYLKEFKGDVFGIDIDFVDVNDDGLQDIIIKYSDETGYSPAVLINNDNLTFTDALSEIKKRESVYVSTELEIGEGGHIKRRGGYKVRNQAGISELVFYDIFIGRTGYRYAIFRYNTNTKNFLLYKKGEVFEEH